MRMIKALGAQHVQACFAREAELTGPLLAAENQAALDGIDITMGWPV